MAKQCANLAQFGLAPTVIGLACIWPVLGHLLSSKPQQFRAFPESSAFFPPFLLVWPSTSLTHTAIAKGCRPGDLLRDLRTVGVPEMVELGLEGGVACAGDDIGGQSRLLV